MCDDNPTTGAKKGVRCCFVKANGQTCRLKVARGERFCYRHCSSKRIALWWLKQERLSVIGIGLSLIGIILGITTYYLSVLDRTGDLVAYYDNSQIQRWWWLKPRLLRIVLSKVTGEIDRVGIRNGTDFFAIQPDPEFALSRQIRVSHGRKDSNLDDYEATFRNVDEARYEPIQIAKEPAIICSDQEGNTFTRITTLIWTKNHYTNATEQIGPLADANFAFADLDGDGTKELVVTHGYRALEHRLGIRFFHLLKDVFVEISPREQTYEEFMEKLLLVKDKGLFDHDNPFREDLESWIRYEQHSWMYEALHKRRGAQAQGMLGD